jgi:oligopeptide/dipeptide ABC transporter ATP-binding protein
MSVATLPVLEVDDLRVQLRGAGGRVGYPVNGVSLRLRRGEILGLVGESGSGKTLLALALMRLLPPAASIASGTIHLAGAEITTSTESEMEAMRGARIAYVPQDPLAALNPVYSVMDQIGEALRAHRSAAGKDVRQRTFDLLADVQIGDPAQCARLYPHQLSGGMRQRVVSAVALAGEPLVLLADEPTTSLDVTVQAAYLRMLRKVQRERGLSIMFITHDLSLVRHLCHRVAVMYAGRIVEIGPATSVFEAPAHPYTRGLLACVPNLRADLQRGQLLADIPGQPPSPFDQPAGCAFYARCTDRRDSRCQSQVPPLREVGLEHFTATFCGAPGPA